MRAVIRMGEHKIYIALSRVVCIVLVVQTALYALFKSNVMVSGELSFTVRKDMDSQLQRFGNVRNTFSYHMT